MCPSGSSTSTVLKRHFGAGPTHPRHGRAGRHRPGAAQQASACGASETGSTFRPSTRHPRSPSAQNITMSLRPDGSVCAARSCARLPAGRAAEAPGPPSLAALRGQRQRLVIAQALLTRPEMVQARRNRWTRSVRVANSSGHSSRAPWLAGVALPLSSRPNPECCFQEAAH